MTQRILAMDEWSNYLTWLTTGLYDDFQGSRKGFMNRFRNLIRCRNEGIPIRELQEKKEVSEQEKMRRETKYADNKLAGIIEKMFAEGKIDQDELKRWNVILKMAKVARNNEDQVKKVFVELMPQNIIWNEYLIHVRGVAETLASKLFVELGDCSKFPNISKARAYCALGIFNDQIQRRQEGVKSNFDIAAKTILIQVAECLMKQNSPIFKEVYNEYKARIKRREPKLCSVSDRYIVIGDEIPGEIMGSDKEWVFISKENYPKFLEKCKENFILQVPVKLSDAHTHRMARRKVAVIFLSLYWTASRELTGQPITETYEEKILEHSKESIITWQQVVEANLAAKMKKAA